MMDINEKLKEICNKAAIAGKSGYIKHHQKWFPKKIFEQFNQKFFNSSALPFSQNLQSFDIQQTFKFAYGLDSKCFIAKDSQDEPLPICIRLTSIHDEQTPRSCIDFNLQAHHVFFNDEYRMEILPLIYVPPSGPKRIGGMPLSRFLKGLCEENHDVLWSRLGTADMGVLPDGTIVNVDAGNCSMPVSTPNEIIHSKFKNDYSQWENLPTQLIWRTSSNQLKQESYFPKPF